jgi:hypothetical protein
VTIIGRLNCISVKTIPTAPQNNPVQHTDTTQSAAWQEYSQGRRRFFLKKTGNGKSKKTGKREKREIFKNNFYINFINGLANQSIFIVY